ncbi:MAG TPA: Gfo/Idh/MocA family oxidoreductase [Rhodospirillales bacterium]|jgi:predicted dehydrogenase|nr:Gfo/Idh/MocA family oxidoreductase [Candidatus Neomarinimicrobiota bacterium]HIO39584.1 Gfo/Idh/MocA family oxidoreductase [Rhodospirillales bacterium]
MSNQTNKQKNTNLERRELIKSLATVPVFGLFLVNLWRKIRRDALKKSNLLSDLVQQKSAPAVIKKMSDSRHLNIGVIGYGGRGHHLVRGAGFAPPGWTQRASENAQKNKLDKAFETYMTQEDLNCSLVGVCDLFDVRAEEGIAASKNETRPGGEPKSTAVRYRHYTELLANDNIDAVIVATPDHWHSRITIDAAKAGKHVYCEKGLTRTFDEAVKVYDTVKKTGIKLQLGHQNRQVEANEKAKEIYKQGLLGPVNLVEIATNRNSPWGAWVWDIHPEGNEETIDWETFQEPCSNKIPWGDGKEALRRFFRWRCWFDYGTGLSGDLLSHDFDAINQIMEIGIPKYAYSTGGIYYYTKERNPEYARDVPDVWNATFEYPDQNLTLLYSATLSSNNPRGNRIMGHDATMQMGGQSGGGSVHGFVVTADSESTLYKDRLKSGIINSNYPIYTYSPGSKQIDGVTSATSRYFANRGLLYTYREGKRVDPTHLHVKDWLDSIRGGPKAQPKCNIDVAFHEAVTCAMATESYKTGRRIEWDPKNRKLI